MNNEQNSKNCNSILHGFQVKRNDKSKSEDTAKKKKKRLNLTVLNINPVRSMHQLKLGIKDEKHWLEPGLSLTIVVKEILWRQIYLKN